MELYLSEADHADVANLDLDDTVRMVVVGKVLSISRPSEMPNVPIDSRAQGKSVTIDIMVESMERKEINLQDALRRAGEKEGILVRTRIEHSP